MPYANDEDKKKHNKRYRERNLERLKEWSKGYREKHRDKIHEERRRWGQKLKKEVIDAFGGKCRCCGEDLLEFLTLDHIWGDGRKHRQQIGGTTKLYLWARDQGYPQNILQVLCINCNCAKQWYGICPHQARQAEDELEWYLSGRYKTESRPDPRVGLSKTDPKVARWL